MDSIRKALIEVEITSAIQESGSEPIPRKQLASKLHLYTCKFHMGGVLMFLELNENNTITVDGVTFSTVEEFKKALTNLPS